MQERLNYLGESNGSKHWLKNERRSCTPVALDRDCKIVAVKWGNGETNTSHSRYLFIV